MKTTILLLIAFAVLAGCSAPAYEMAPSVEKGTYAKRVKEDKKEESRTEEVRQAVEPSHTSPKMKMREDGFSLAPSHYAEVWLEAGSPDLGAYHVELQYDPSVIIVESIETAPAGALAASPISKPQTFATGRTGIVGIAPGGAKAQGRVIIARVIFRPVAEGTSKLGVILKSIKDPLTKDITGTTGIEPQQITVSK